MTKRLYALLTMTFLVLSALVPTVSAIDVNQAAMTDPEYPIQWVPGGEAAMASMLQNPEYLKVRTETHISHDTRITILGLDTNGQPVSGIAVNKWSTNLGVMFDMNNPATWIIPASTQSEYYFPVVDVHSGKEVTFAKITAIYQQGGEVCNSFKIGTMPEPIVASPFAGPVHPGFYQEYLAYYSTSAGFKPVMMGGYPMEPSNPDPIKILVNWYDQNNNGKLDPIPTDQYLGAQSNGTLRIKGFDQNGNMVEILYQIITSVANPAGTLANPLVLPGIWSDICFIDGGAVGDSYNIFTHPVPQRDLVIFKNKITKIDVKVSPKNILADGKATAKITVTWYDADGHALHWSKIAKNMTINVIASGGKVAPSIMTAPGCWTNVNTTITSDTSARIIKVSALAHFPQFPNHPEQQLTASTLMGFDGVSAVQTWGTHVESLGGPSMMALIKLYPGANLVSIPIFPYETIMASQLAKTSASTTLIRICMYNATGPHTGVWLTWDYTTASGSDFPLKPGYGYWVLAEKPSTIYISGTWYGNCNFVPPEHMIFESWNLMGVTSAWGINLGDYLASLGDDWAGFAWLYNNDLKTWFRIGPNDAIWPGQAFWVSTTGSFIAP